MALCPLICFLLGLNFLNVLATEFSYKDVERWAQDFKECGGNSQSPIDIRLTDIVKDDTAQAIKFSRSFNRVVHGRISNNGHSAQLELSEEQRKDMIISCGPFGTDKYRFLQLHFHWGANDSIGSEHTFGHVQFPAEMHWVHYNTKYGSPSEAILEKDGLAVLGFMIDVDDIIYNKDFEVIASAVAKLGKPGSTADIELNIYDLWSENPLPLGNYYSYAGSLTTPACSEVVRWVVFAVPVVIPSNQLLPFRSLSDSKGDAMVDNFRPIQPLNKRRVSTRNIH